MFVAFGLMVTAQTQLSESQSNEVIASLTKTAASMQSMQCRFVQEKTSSMLAEPSVAEVFSKDGYVKGFPGAGAFIKDNMDGTVTGNVEFPCIAGIREMEG